MSLYRAYFVPGAVDPEGTDVTSMECKGWKESSCCYDYCRSDGHSNKDCLKCCNGGGDCSITLRSKRGITSLRALGLPTRRESGVKAGFLIVAEITNNSEDKTFEYDANVFGKILPGSKIWHRPFDPNIPGGSLPGEFVDPSHNYVEVPLSVDFFDEKIGPGETKTVIMSQAGRSVIAAPGWGDRLYHRDGNMIRFRIKGVVTCGDNEQSKEWESDTEKLNEERERRRRDRERKRQERQRSSQE